MSFLFCAPKEKNEVKEKDENFFMVFERKDEESFWDEELCCKWSKKKRSCKCLREIKEGVFLSQSGDLLYLLRYGLFLQIWGLFWPFQPNNPKFILFKFLIGFFFLFFFHHFLQIKSLVVMFMVHRVRTRHPFKKIFSTILYNKNL